MNDLNAVRLALHSTVNAFLPATNGRMVQGAFLRLVSSYSRALAEQLHCGSHGRPYTLSALRGPASPPAVKAPLSRIAGLIPVREGSVYNIRITSLCMDISYQLLNMFEEFKGAELKIGDATFMMGGVDVSKDKRTGSSMYESLWQMCLNGSQSPLPWFAWSFLSATAIHSGRRNLLFPEPESLFPQLAGRWNAFCPEHLLLPYANDKHFSRLAGESLMASAGRLRTHMLDFGAKGRQIGFTGIVTFQPRKQASSDLLNVFELLGHFSFYSGIGYATTKGMGQAAFIVP